MKESNTQFNLTTVGVTVLLFLSLITAGYFISTKGSISKELNDEKLKSESLLSQKLQLEKDIEKFRKEIANLNGQNKDLDRMLVDAKSNLDKKEQQIRQLSKDNASIGSLRKEIANLKNLKAQYEGQMATLNSDLIKLRQDNDLMRKEASEAQKMIARLQNENKKLMNDLDVAVAMTNNSLSEAIKKNNRLTVNSRRARKIMVAFDVPQKSLSGLDFKITSPNDKIFTVKDGSISHRLILNDGNPVASLDHTMGIMEASQRVVMEYAPKTKLEKGVYTVDVLSNGKVLGRMQVKLK
jgi:myosin heavy subunit